MHKNIFIVLTLLTGISSAAIHIDATGGFGIQSKYRYFEIRPETEGSQWLTFDPINDFCASSRISIDVWKKQFRFGFYGCFVRHYDLTSHSQTIDGITSETIGEMISLPLIGFLEGRHRSFFYEFGLGPYITRFNYRSPDLPQFTVSPLFGFLFGGGYNHQLFPGMSLLFKGEMLVNAPVFLVDHLDTKLDRQLHDSRYTEYNINDFQAVIFNASVSVGVQYEFGNNISIPIHKLFECFSIDNTTELLENLKQNN